MRECGCDTFLHARVPRVLLMFSSCPSCSPHVLNHVLTHGYKILLCITSCHTPPVSYYSPASNRRNGIAILLHYQEVQPIWYIPLCLVVYMVQRSPWRTPDLVFRIYGWVDLLDYLLVWINSRSHTGLLLEYITNKGISLNVLLLSCQSYNVFTSGL